MANPYWMPWLPIEIWLLCKIIILEGVGEDLPSLYYDNYLLAHRARSFVNNYFLFCLSDDAFIIYFQRVSFKTTGLHEWLICLQKNHTQECIFDISIPIIYINLLWSCNRNFILYINFLVFDLMMLDVHFEAVHIVIMITVNFRRPL